MSAELQTNVPWRPAGTAPEAGPSPGPEIEVVSSYRGLLALEGEWNDLYARAGVQHPFLTHEWIRTWWECFGAPAGLEILVFRDRAAGAIAVVPLMADATRMFGVGLARLGLPWNFHTPRLGLVVAERHEEVYRRLWEHLGGPDRRWDLLRLCQLPEGARESRRLADLAASEGFLVGRWTSGGAPFVEVRGSWDDYFAGLSKKHRGTVRNRHRRLERLGAVELETVDGSGGAGELEDALAEGFRLEGAAWKEAAGTAILSHQETEAFYRLLARRAAARGWLRLHFLSVGGRRVAFLYSLLHEGTLYALKGGYAPELARSSPGVVLFSQILEDAFARGLSRIDFLGEEERWKLDWTRRTREHHWLYVFRPSPRARLVHLLKFGLAPRTRRAEAAPPPFHLPSMAHSAESRP